MTVETDRSFARDQPESPQARRTRWRSARVWAPVAVVLLVGVAVVLIWFEPHKLFVDERVDQAVPTAEPTTTSAGAAGTDDVGSGRPGTTTAPAGPVDLATGEFVGLDHTTTGTARILELADGQRFVRLEGLETDNGPDLYVYLSTNPAGGPEEAFDDQYANLGRLQGNIGNQNYDLPADVDHSGYASVVIWCDRFDSAFGAADLTAAPA
jgi:Electron transfer DM13